MNSSLTARTILLYIVLLPLAVVFGYVIASPLDYANLGVIGIILAALLAPVLIRHHQPLIIFCWNAYLSAILLPGDLPLWIPMALATLAFAVLHRIIDKRVAWIDVRSVTISLLALLVVILLTAQSTGGMGVRVLGGSSFGGKSYLYLLAAIAGYFAISSTRIPIEKAVRYLGLFFLPVITAVVGHIAFALGPVAYFLFFLFPSDLVLNQAQAEFSGSGGMVRLNGVTIATISLMFYCLARFGLAGMLDLSRPFRIISLITLGILSLLGGFRSMLLLTAMVFAIKFVMEGLWRTRFMAGLLVIGLLGAAILVPLSSRLPQSMQRALSFLPIEVSPEIRAEARDSTDWRLEMWSVVAPTLPNYVIRGRGYNLDPGAMYLTDALIRRGLLPDYERAIEAMSFHSGFLTLFVSFGSFGVAAFLFFLLSSLRLLFLNCRHGDPRLRNINELLFSLFLARAIFYFAVFGTFYLDLAQLIGLVGLSVALNNGVARTVRPVPQPASSLRSIAAPLPAG